MQSVLIKQLALFPIFEISQLIFVNTREPPLSRHAVTFLEWHSLKGVRGTGNFPVPLFLHS